MSKKITSPQDFSGQKTQNAGEGAGNPEQRPSRASVPEGAGRKVAVLASDNDRIHISRLGPG